MATEDPQLERTEETESAVGTHVTRVDAKNKVTGSITYTDDIEFEGYYAKLVRSNVPHGTISEIDTEEAEAHPGVRSVVTGADLEDADWVTPKIGPAFRDQPLLASGRIRYLGEPVAAVIAESPVVASTAADKVYVNADRLDVVEDVSQARSDDALQIHDHEEVSAVFDDLKSVKQSDESNVAYTYRYEDGDVDEAFERADLVMEGSYSTPMIQHTHLEPFVTIAKYDAGTDSFRIVTGNQTPHFVKQEVARIFDLPTSDISVQVPQMGGSYGAKTYARIEPLTAALSRAVEAPVKLRQTSSESFDTAVRDGTEVTVKTGVTEEGNIVAQQVDVVWDTGAYADIGPRKAKKAGYTAVGAYEIDNASITSKCTYTNKPPGVAYRGFGVAQTAWAVESHLDNVARELGIDRYELRLRNVVQDDGVYNGSSIGTHGVPACMDAVVEAAGWRETKLDQPEADNLVRGRGMAITLKATITPSTSEAIALLDSDGSVNLVTGSTKVGQGVETTLCQIAAEELGISIDRISVNPVDTDVAPFNTSTTSSRTTFHMGNAVIRAIDDVKSQLVDFAAEQFGTDPSEINVRDGVVRDDDGNEGTFAEVVQNRFVGGGGTVIGKGYYTTEKSSDDGETEQPGEEDTWKAAEAEGDVSDYESAFWMSGATVAEVTVDVDTGKYRVDRWINATDAGNAIDPDRVRDQIRGAAVQGLGHVRSEEMVFESGQQVNKSLLDYKVPSIEDIPDESETIIVENADPDGPYGAKGVGEANTVTVPPAVGNAIADATGVQVHSLPVTPEKVLKQIEEAEQ